MNSLLEWKFSNTSFAAFQLVKKLRFTDPKEQAIFCEAFCDLTAFVAETMNFAYSQCQQQAALNSRKKPDRDSPKS